MSAKRVPCLVASHSSWRHWWLPLGLFVVPVVYGLISLRTGLGMVSDSAVGFLVLKAMQNGGAFNVLVQPDPANIAIDTTHFVSWWSPGQYLVPGAIHALGMSLGTATTITVTLSSVLGLLGYVVLYRSFGFRPKTVVLSCLLIALSSWFASPFTTYNGGEVLLFAVAPWLSWIVWRLRTLPPVSIPALVLGFMAVTMAKLTGAIIAFSLLCGAVYGALGQPHREIVRRIAIAALAGLAFAILLYFVWLRHGGTPATALGDKPHASWLTAIAFPVKSLLTAPLGIGDALTYYLNNSSGLQLKLLKAVNACIGIGSLLIYWYVWKAMPEAFSDYRKFTFSAVGVYVAVFMVLYLYGAPISLEDRHFRAISLLAVAGAVHVFTTRSGRVLRWAATVAFLLTLTYGVTSFAASASRNVSLALGSHGFRHPAATPELFNFIRERVERSDTMPADYVVLVPSNDLGLEITNARVITVSAEFKEVAMLSAQRYSGRVKRLDVLLQKALIESGKVDAILRSFKDYEFHQWKQIDVGTFICFTQEAP
jgi:hypothetical protein